MTREQAIYAANQKRRNIGFNLRLLRADVKHYLSAPHCEQFNVPGLLDSLECALLAAVAAEELDATKTPAP